jgi:hypothetical protein
MIRKNFTGSLPEMLIPDQNIPDIQTLIQKIIYEIMRPKLYPDRLFTISFFEHIFQRFRRSSIQLFIREHPEKMIIGLTPRLSRD